MVASVANYKYELIQHKEADQDLLIIDPTHPEFGKSIVTAESGEPTKHKSLKIEFSLKPSSYATMVIREITKLPTVSNVQAK